MTMSDDVFISHGRTLRYTITLSALGKIASVMSCKDVLKYPHSEYISNPVIHAS